MRGSCERISTGSVAFGKMGFGPVLAHPLSSSPTLTTIAIPLKKTVEGQSERRSLHEYRICDEIWWQCIQALASFIQSTTLNCDLYIATMIVPIQTNYVGFFAEKVTYLCVCTCEHYLFYIHFLS